MTVGQLDAVLLVGALVLLLAIATSRLSAGTGLPSLVLYVGLGMLIGEDGLGVRFDDPQLAQVLGYAALVVILAEGGLTTRWSSVRSSVGLAASLSTLGVAVSVLVTALLAEPLLGLDLRTAALLGAVLASTDAAAVFSLLRHVPLPERLAGALEAESGFNDAPVVIVVAALAQAPLEPSDGWRLPLLLLWELGAGSAVGLGVGALGAWSLRRVALPSAGVFPLAVVAVCVLAYAGAAVPHASGFLAVYVAGLVLGNGRLPHRPATRGFVEGLGWLAQIGLFVMLGLLASPSRLPGVVLPALALSAVLLLVARPLAVAVAVAPFALLRRWGLRVQPVPWRHGAFLSWAGLRGGVPIVLATVPVVEHVPGAQRLFGVVLVLVVVSTLVQAPTLGRAATLLRLADPLAAREIDVEASPLGLLGADLLEVRVPAGSQIAGVEVFELRLPAGASLALVVREGVAEVPTPRTVLRAGDELLLVVTPEARTRTEHRIAEVSRHGRLGRWTAPPA
ncbi:potassium/proton antiporter (CPA1 family) [Motilibacter rhizosphaerae]|uniref:Potassium/proton antiporter (CPA1 family) n=1 Tax=Motilibacter rhizosphaerae TaxID=598652 RepID=A0A4Q7NQ55_9ACTN|nr:potassium/proton antiporter [Motilibacter rhizosphaerae]RZS87464.1 potassium/proton antiporter (CPA1 family) [Motilibacter rhizosphaerae]